MSGAIRFEEYSAKKGEVELRVYRKYDRAPHGKPVLLLVHGSSFSALPGYDLQVPGRGSQYSMMDQCALRGFDVWTLDHEGYGASTRTSNNANIAQGAEDIAAIMPVIARGADGRRIHLYGQSSGSLRAALFAQRNPERVDRLVLDAFVWTGKGSATLARRREQIDRWRASHVRGIDRETLRNSFTRDKPGTSEEVMIEAIVSAQLAYGNTIPTGTYVDMCERLPIVEPEKIVAPTLIMRGEHDGIATMDDLAAFFDKLPNGDKQLSVLSGSAHIAPFGLNAHRFYHILFSFLEMPAMK